MYCKSLILLYENNKKCILGGGESNLIIFSDFVSKEIFNYFMVILYLILYEYEK